MSEALKPCPNPWCGSTETIRVSALGQDDKTDGEFRSCLRCSLNGPIGQDEDQAIRLWNTRALSPMVERDAVIEECAAVADKISRENFAKMLKAPPGEDEVYTSQGAGAAAARDAIRLLKAKQPGEA